MLVAGFTAGHSTPSVSVRPHRRRRRRLLAERQLLAERGDFAVLAGEFVGQETIVDGEHGDHLLEPFDFRADRFDF